MCPSVFSALPLLLLLLLAVHIAWGDAEQFSFYDLLGVRTDADVRSIRRAFKRLALEKHPDKNPDDPEAHDVFVRINRAYEVLKDEELRKRYDQFGEKGLENNNAGAQRQQWESWEFYNDKFGIYDDDQEIVTLSRADFEEEVFESGEIWFVNFYSTYCSHCHHLAPTWREFAKSMDGIARIGAVNCAEDPELCQSQQVNAYPSLVLFPQRLWFRGARDLAPLSAFLLANLPSQPLRSPAQFPQNGRPLLVELDDGESEGMGEDERIKCAAMLQWLGGTLAVLECADGGNDVKMCEELGHRDGFLFYPRGAEDGEATEVFFADLVDLRSQLHHLLPALPRLSADELRWLISRPPDQDNEPMLALFVNPARGTDHPEWRTLAQRFPQMNVHVVECADSDDEMLAICAELHLGHLPRPVLFRPSGGYDIHYGNAQMDTRQVAKFIVRSGKSHLIVLNADKYEKHFAKESAAAAAAGGDTLWLVDHFVPWCQPCLRLLAELRKLPPEAEGHALRLGAVNCEAEPDICRRAGITSYPHSVLFSPDGVRHPIVGSHSVEQLLEFVAEALSPSVAVLNRTSFVQNVVHRPNGHLYFVDFHAPWCGPCQQLAPEFRRLARQFPLLSPQADIVSVAEYVHSFPTIRLYRHRHDLQPYDYPPNWWRNAQSMTHWLAEMMPTLVQRLAGDFHSTVLGSVQPFLVDFYAPWCGHCVHFAPTFEKLAKLLEGQVQLGKVDCDRFGHICQMAGVQAFPSVVLYSGVDRVGDRQNARGIFVRHGGDANRMADEVREMLRQRGKGTHWQERDEL
uniref:DnaJ homolog subfamily C member 10 n=1 Tax=Globodera rostochiensis TaxID=31243 RepID=A0A914HEM4_GLORO